MDTQVIIFGAGPVGLTLAVDLGLRGVRCILLEKRSEPQFLPKMERCNARSMEMFRRIGLADELPAAGLTTDAVMDVYIILKMTRAPLLHLKYPSVDLEAKPTWLNSVRDIIGATSSMIVYHWVTGLAEVGTTWLRTNGRPF